MNNYDFCDRENLLDQIRELNSKINELENQNNIANWEINVVTYDPRTGWDFAKCEICSVGWADKVINVKLIDNE